MTRYRAESLDRRVDAPRDDDWDRDELREALQAGEAEVVVKDHHEREQRGDHGHGRDGSEQRLTERDHEQHGEEVETHAVNDKQQRDDRAADRAEDAPRGDRMRLTNDRTDVR